MPSLFGVVLINVSEGSNVQMTVFLLSNNREAAHATLTVQIGLFVLWIQLGK